MFWRSTGEAWYVAVSGANGLWVLFNLFVLLLLDEGNEEGSNRTAGRREGGIKVEIGEEIREWHPVGGGGEKI